jgi:hypothetical protein
MQQRLSSAQFVCSETRTASVSRSIYWALSGARMRHRPARRTVVPACRRRWSCRRPSSFAASQLRQPLSDRRVKRASNAGTRCIAARLSEKGLACPPHTVARVWAPVSGPTS